MCTFIRKNKEEHITYLFKPCVSSCFISETMPAGLSTGSKQQQKQKRINGTKMENMGGLLLDARYSVKGKIAAVSSIFLQAEREKD